MLGTRSILATEELASTKKSAPLISITNPRTNKMYTIILSLFLSLLRASSLYRPPCLFSICQKSEAFAVSQGHNKSLAYYMRTGLLLLSRKTILPAAIVMTITHNTLSDASYSLLLPSVYSLFRLLSRAKVLKSAGNETCRDSQSTARRLGYAISPFQRSEISQTICRRQTQPQNTARRYSARYPRFRIFSWL